MVLEHVIYLMGVALGPLIPMVLAGQGQINLFLEEHVETLVMVPQEVFMAGPEQQHNVRGVARQGVRLVPTAHQELE